jgi:hypothetical protein
MRYAVSNKQKAPAIALTMNRGQESTTAEAAMNPQTHYPAKRLWTQGRKVHDLPLMQHRMQSLWKAQKRPTALPLQSVP